MSEEKKKRALVFRTVVGGPGKEPKAWDDWVWGLRDFVKPLVEELHTPVHLAVEFRISGPILSNDFQGVRTGRYFKKDNVLMVQAAVPEGEGLDRWQVLVGLLADAVNAAQAHVRKRKIAEGLPELQAVVEQVQAMDPPAEVPEVVWGNRRHGDVVSDC